MTQANKLKYCEMMDSDASLTIEMLVRKYTPAVLGLCLAHTKNVHDAEDVMQNVLLKAFENLSSLRDPDKARPWLLQIARRLCIDHYRKRRPTQSIPDDMPSAPDSPDDRFERLHTAIAKLSQDQRETITLYYMDGCKCSRVAQTLGIREDAVRRRLVRARLALYDLLLEGQS